MKRQHLDSGEAGNRGVDNKPNFPCWMLFRASPRCHPDRRDAAPLGPEAEGSAFRIGIREKTSDRMNKK